MKTGAGSANGSQQSLPASELSFGDDAEFAQALVAAADQLTPTKSDAAERQMVVEEAHQAGNDDAGDDGAEEKQMYMSTDAYKPSAFGDFRSYAKNKRLKLKVQEVSMSEDEARAAAGSSKSAAPLSFPPLFKGTNIYINGHTNPPYGELRRLLHLHGGSLMPYLDQKTPVTHIVASNLTAKKRIEFKDYRVVRPEWITDSIAQQKRLDWRDFRCAEDASGAMKRGTLQERAKVNGGDAAARIKQEEAEVARKQAALGDWRSMAGEDSRAAAQYPGGVGPWGRASRQKTLAGWAWKAESGGAASMEKLESNDEPDERSQGGGEAVARDDGQPQRQSPSSEAWLVNLETPPRPTQTAQVVPPGSDDRVHISLGTDPPSEAAAVAAGHRHPSHPYASRPSNIAAAQLLASPSWRHRNTATGDDFLAGFFGKSRLHHLSTWKSEMKEMVSQALREAGKEQGSVNLPAGVKRVIMHVDFDAFFVSVGLRNRPDLQDKPVVVCHGSSTQERTSGGSTVHSTSEIASCNYIARSSGIRNGMSLGQAKRLCAHVCSIPYDFEAYNDVAIRFYTFLLLHADALEAVSIDEALVDVSLLLDEMRRDVAGKSDVPERQRLMNSYKDLMNSQGEGWSEEKQLAEALRDGIRESTGCEASIGSGDNVLLARMATRRAKPGGAYHLDSAHFQEFSAELDVDDLHGIGWSIRTRCKDLFGTCKIAELNKRVTRAKLIAEFGERQGVTIWDKLHGRERDRLESIKPRQSCGASVNYAIRFETLDEAREFVRKLCDEVASRLQAIQLVGKVCSVSIMVRSEDAPVEAPKFLGHGICDTHNRSAPFDRPTGDVDAIFSLAWKLIAALNIPANQLRGIGVSCQKLQPKGKSVDQAKLSFASPVKRPGGALLSEGREIIVSPSKPVPAAVPESDEGSLKESAVPDELEPGPSNSGLRRRRSLTPEEKPIASTQFVIPPASQLDADVLAALPKAIQAQIQHAGGGNAEKSERGEGNLAGVRAASAEPAMSGVSMSTASTPEKRRTAINPFLAMRAASTTPTKKVARQAKAREVQMPTFSQLDPAVLAELPEDVRQEILRGVAGAGAAQSTSPSPKSDRMDKRTPSESPRKKQRLLDGAKPSRLRQQYPLPGSHSLDPAQVTEDDLMRLEIDPGFFAGLPEEVQRETLEEQARQIADRQARFKSGKHLQELSVREERRLHTQIAYPHDDLQARSSSTDDAAPNLKGHSTLEELRQLLSSWLTQFQSTGPRHKDVERFARFLVECVEMHDLAHLDKVRGVLRWWKAALDRPPLALGSNGHAEWSRAFDSVRTQVNERVTVHFGGTLSLR